MTDLVLARYLRTLRGGVLVTMQPGLNLAAARLGTRNYIRIAQDHRPTRSRPSTVLQAYAKHAQRLDALLTLTDADTKYMREVTGGKVLVRTMPNGGPPPMEPLSGERTKTVVAAGRLERSKGFDILIDAWARVAQHHPDWRLRIYGEGTRRPDLEAQIEVLHLTEQVSLPGFTAELPRALQAAAFFVLSSRVEGYARVILEAMAAGLPVISTDCPSGPREMIEHGVDGLLVTNKSSHELSDAIIELIEMGPQGRKEMGAAATTRIRANSQARVAESWVQLIAELQGSS